MIYRHKTLCTLDSEHGLKKFLTVFLNFTMLYPIDVLAFAVSQSHSMMNKINKVECVVERKKATQEKPNTLQGEMWWIAKPKVTYLQTFYWSWCGECTLYVLRWRESEWKWKQFYGDKIKQARHTKNISYYHIKRPSSFDPVRCTHQ